MKIGDMVTGGMVISTKDSWVRNNPIDKDLILMVGKYPSGTVFILLDPPADEQGNFYHVLTPDGKKGWIHEENCNEIFPR